MNLLLLCVLLGTATAQFGGKNSPGEWNLNQVIVEKNKIGGFGGRDNRFDKLGGKAPSRSAPRRQGDKFKFQGDSFEREAWSDDYDYDFNDRLNDVTSYASPLYRVTNTQARRTYMHANRQDIDNKKKKGFQGSTVLGKIIPMLVWTRNRGKIQQRCSSITELYYAGNAQGAQKLVTSQPELNKVTAKGTWKKFSSVGMCMKQRGQCGATDALYELQGTKAYDGNILYTTSENEVKQLVKSGNFRQTDSKPICYIWD